MKNAIQRDSIMTVVSVAIVAALFVFTAYLPGRRSAIPINRSIDAAEQRLREIPVRIAELELLDAQIDRLETYLEEVDSVVPQEADLHSIIGEVAGLAKASQLKVTRLEPMPPVIANAYDVVPFRVNLSGSFAGVVEFLNGLSDQDRLFAIDELSMSHPTRQAGDSITVEMRFSTYVLRVENSGFAEFNAS